MIAISSPIIIKKKVSFNISKKLKKNIFTEIYRDKKVFYKKINN
jgi:hypothetical protein